MASAAASSTRLIFWALLLVQAAGCRSDVSRNSPASVGVPGSLASSLPELPNDEATPSKTTATSHEADLLRRNALADGGLVMLSPTPLREDSRLVGDAPGVKDSTGVTLEAEWKAPDWPVLPANPGIERERLVEIRNKTKWSLRIDLVGSGRMRVTLASRGFPLEKGTEIRSRVDLLGHVLVWPDENQYRILAAGTLRSLFEEGLVDVGPALTTNFKPAGTGHWLDWDTERVSASNALGHIVMEQATVAAAGASGRLLCRWLVEFISADPTSSVCQSDTVPVRAQFEFSGGGKAEFAVSQVSKKQEYASPSIAVPPTGTAVNSHDIPRATLSSDVLLAEHRNHTPHNPAASPAPGLVATNHTLGLRALLVDGVTAAWLMPAEERSLPELQPGNYSVGWRDFLGVSVEPPKAVTLPARIVVGVAP